MALAAGAGCPEGPSPAGRAEAGHWLWPPAVRAAFIHDQAGGGTAESEPSPLKRPAISFFEFCFDRGSVLTRPRLPRCGHLRQDQ